MEGKMLYIVGKIINYLLKLILYETDETHSV
jgi:hypothetical protein